MTKPVKKRSKMTIARRVVVAAAFVACVVGVLAFGGAGSYCSFGVDAIAAICPLGSLEALFGSWAVAPRALIVLAVVVVLGVVFGKAFCSWACPVPPLDRFLRTKKSRRKDVDERHQAAAESLERWHACSSCGACSSHCASADGAQAADGENALACAKDAAVAPKEKDGQETDVEKALAGKRRFRLDSRHLVLAGSLVSAAACGFPVFCLVCPIGLTIASVIALYRFVGFNELTLSLVVFPAVIVLELVVLRKWCHRFCPVGALLSLISSFGSKMTRPRVDHDRCLRAESEPCTACASVCPEHIDPVADLGRRPLSECTRCGRCADACPHDAISFTKRGLALRRNESARKAADA